MSMNKKQTEVEIATSNTTFTVEFSYNDHWTDVKVFRPIWVEPVDGGELKIYNKLNYTTTPAPVRNIKEAQPYMTGFVKWDGCCEFTQHENHWCGRGMVEDHCQLMLSVFNTAIRLMKGEGA